jgi:sulfite reductase (NADPH) hemoprotein beta-component
MYQYTEFDRQFIRSAPPNTATSSNAIRPAQLSDDEFRPLRLQNGWYVQRYAPMLRVAVPYGELSSAQLRVLAKIARDYDRPDAVLLDKAQLATQATGATRHRAGLATATSAPARMCSSTGSRWKKAPM